MFFNASPPLFCPIRLSLSNIHRWKFQQHQQKVIFYNSSCISKWRLLLNTLYSAPQYRVLYAHELYCESARFASLKRYSDFTTHSFQLVCDPVHTHANVLVSMHECVRPNNLQYMCQHNVFNVIIAFLLHSCQKQEAHSNTFYVFFYCMFRFACGISFCFHCVLLILWFVHRNQTNTVTKPTTFMHKHNESLWRTVSRETAYMHYNLFILLLLQSIHQPNRIVRLNLLNKLVDVVNI